MLVQVSRVPREILSGLVAPSIAFGQAPLPRRLRFYRFLRQRGNIKKVQRGNIKKVTSSRFPPFPPSRTNFPFLPRAFMAFLSRTREDRFNT